MNKRYYPKYQNVSDIWTDSFLSFKTITIQCLSNDCQLFMIYTRSYEMITQYSIISVKCFSILPLCNLIQYFSKHLGQCYFGESKSLQYFGSPWYFYWDHEGNQPHRMVKCQAYLIISGFASKNLEYGLGIHSERPLSDFAWTFRFLQTEWNIFNLPVLLYCNQ